MAKKIQMPKIELQGANFDEDSYSATHDWRYELLVDYLKLSPSYQSICKSNGRKFKNAPIDWTQIAMIYADFGDVFEMRESQWWQKIGLPLFGLKAAKTESFVISENSGNTLLSKEVINNANHAWKEMAMPDSLVLAIPRTQTKQQALKQVTAIIRSMNFASSKELNTKPKYKLCSSKLRKETLVFGVEALKLYRRGAELWKIGYKLELSTIHTNYIIHQENIAESRRYLAVLASKLIHKAENIAENAARGNFPSDKSLRSSTPRLARKVGRPKSK